MIKNNYQYLQDKVSSPNDILPQVARVGASTKRNDEKLNPDAQWIIREKAVVDRIQNSVVHANEFELGSFRLRLEMYDHNDKEEVDRSS